jgi:hypothetical protein
MTRDKHRKKSFWSSLANIFQTSPFPSQRYEVWKAISTTDRLLRENDRLIHEPTKLDMTDDTEIEFQRLSARVDKYRRWGLL